MTHTKFEETLFQRYKLKELPCSYKDEQTAVYDFECMGVSTTLYHVLHGSSVIPSPLETDENFVQNMHSLQVETGKRVVIIWSMDEPIIAAERWTPVLWNDIPALLPLDSLLKGSHGEEELSPTLHEAIMAAFNIHHPEAWRKFRTIYARVGGHDIASLSEVVPAMLALHEEFGDVQLSLLQKTGQLYRLALLNLEKKAGIKVAVEDGNIRKITEIRVIERRKVFKIGEPKKKHELIPRILRTIREWHLSSPEDLSINFIIDSTDIEEGLGKKYHLDIRSTIKNSKEDIRRIEQTIKEKKERGENPSAEYAVRARIEGMLA